MEASAATPVYLATLPEVENVTGKYFVKKQIAETSAISRERELQRNLWKVSAELTGLDEINYEQLEATKKSAPDQVKSGADSIRLTQ